VSFRLTSLLRVRSLQQDIAAAGAGSAAARAGAARRASAERQDELALSGFAAHGDARTFAAAVAARSASTHRYVESLALAGELDTRSAQARADWVAARRRTVPLEKLQERSDAADAVEDLRAEQAVLDEHGARTRTDPESAR
jgi:flagellar protein FliJ